MPKIPQQRNIICNRSNEVSHEQNAFRRKSSSVVNCSIVALELLLIAVLISSGRTKLDSTTIASYVFIQAQEDLTLLRRSHTEVDPQSEDFYIYCRAFDTTWSGTDVVISNLSG